MLLEQPLDGAATSEVALAPSSASPTAAAVRAADSESSSPSAFPTDEAAEALRGTGSDAGRGVAPGAEGAEGADGAEGAEGAAGGGAATPGYPPPLEEYPGIAGYPRL